MTNNDSLLSTKITYSDVSSTTRRWYQDMKPIRIAHKSMITAKYCRSARHFEF